MTIYVKRHKTATFEFLLKMTDMDNEKLIGLTAEYVRNELQNAEGGHDWWHIYRVWKLAKAIATEENANPLVVGLAVLLHDIADPKFHNGDESIGPALAEKHLFSIGVEKNVVIEVVDIIKKISFKNSFGPETEESLEMKVVRDADRLDAMGAIGIARAFSYGGFRNRPIYDPGIPPVKYRSKEEYMSGAGPTINHFYEKLLLLKEGMKTATGKKLAVRRHEFMENYLEEFFKEWDGVV